MEKLTLKKMLRNKIDNSPRGFGTELAKIAGYDKVGGLTKQLDDEEKEFNSLYGVIKMVQFAFEAEEQNLLEEYSKTLDPNNKLARYMLEYLYCNRRFDGLKELIDRMSNCKNGLSKEWAKLYSIQYEWQVNYYDLNETEIINSLNEFKTNTPELLTLIKIIKCNSFYRKKAFKISFELSNDILSLLDEIKDEYIKLTYTTKYNEIMSYLSLRVLNKPMDAKKYAEKVLESSVSRTYSSYAMYIKGCSTFFTSYDESKECFKESIEMYEHTNRKQAANDVREIAELLDVVWDKDIFTVNFSKEYKLYWLVKNNKLTSEVSKDLDEPFYYLIQGIKENSTDKLMQSLIKFVKRGDTFLGTLSKIELIKRGFSEVIVNEIVNLHK